MPKKGRTFQCVGFDGCNMSFTRSEHLARHIRKHTGERPFNCQHCNRKFSRLDNLRQHKQTVHVYENFVLTYPGDKITVRVKTEDLKRVSKIMGNDAQQPLQPQSQPIQQPQQQQLPPIGFEKPNISANRLPPPRVSSELFNQSLAFRPKELNRPQPILIPSPPPPTSTQMAPLPFLTPQTSSPYSPQSPIMATSPRIRSSFGTDLTAYSLPLTPNSDTRLPVTKKNWLTNVLNDDI